MAETLVYGELSTGAQDDLARATEIAHSMVKAHAMGRDLGQLTFERERRPFLPEPGAHHERGDYSEEVARRIDTEVRRIVDEQHARARQLLGERVPVLREAARALIAHETLTGEELARIVARFALPTSVLQPERKDCGGIAVARDSCAATHGPAALACRPTAQGQDPPLGIEVGAVSPGQVRSQVDPLQLTEHEPVHST